MKNIGLILLLGSLSLFTAKIFSAPTSNQQQFSSWQHQVAPTNLEQRLLAFSQQLQNQPYKRQPDLIGEGTQCVTKSMFCQHLQPLPMIRTDFFDCYSYLITMLALASSHSWAAFEDHIKQLNYNHLHHLSPQISFFNRNHFMAADFNPNSRALGLSTNAHLQPILNAHSQTLVMQTNRYPWMVQQLHRLPLTSLRLRQALQRHDLAQLNFNETVALQYLPTHSLVQPSRPGHFVRTALYQHLPTPSIAEWVQQQPSHKQKSAILVSHVGLLLRQDFQYGQLIYPEVRCQPAHHSIKSKCWVVPHYCQQHKGCQKLMFSNATSKYPKHCFLTTHHGHYQIGQADTPHSFSCNRVVNVPLFTYLTEHMVGRPPLINNSKILGLHLETIQTVPDKTQQ